MLKVVQTASAEACFSGLSDVHECSIVFKWLDKQTAGNNSLHDWSMSLAMDLAALCDMWMYIRKMTPVDAIWPFSMLM